MIYLYNGDFNWSLIFIQFELKDAFEWTFKDFLGITSDSVYSGTLTSKYRADLQWQLKLRPRRFSDGREYVALYLYNPLGKRNEVVVNCALSVIDESGKAACELKFFRKDFTQQDGWGYPTYLDRSKMPSKLVDGSLIVRAEITYVRMEKQLDEVFDIIDKANSARNRLRACFDAIDNDDSDFRIRVEGRAIGVHRVLLRNCPFFDKLFKKEKIKEFDVKKVSYKTMMRLIQFIYIGEIDISNVGIALELFDAANRFELDELAKTCVEFVSNSFTDQNAINILMFATKALSSNYAKDDVNKLIADCKSWLIAAKANKIKLRNLPNYDVLTARENHDVFTKFCTTFDELF